MTAAPNIDAERLEFLGWATESYERFCGLLDIITKQGKRAKLELNHIQKLFCVERTGRDIILKPRQVGITTAELARDVFEFLNVQGAQVEVVCQSIDGDGPINGLSEKVRRYFESLRRLGVRLDFATERANEWRLGDALLRISTAGASEASASKKGRSGTITRLHVTELAYFEFADQTMNALIESVPQGSDIIIESTPNGASGLFFRQCKAAERNESGYRLHFYPWHVNPEYSTPLDDGERVESESEAEERLVAKGVTPEQRKWRRQKIAGKGADAKGGQDLFDQEYPSDPDTCFLTSGRRFFDVTAVKRLVESATEQPSERRERDRVRIWEAPTADGLYVLAVDTSEGGGGDPSGAVMYDRISAKIVAVLDGQFPPHELAVACDKLGREYNAALLVVERNNTGHAVHAVLEHELFYPCLYIEQDGKLGWNTTAITKPIMLDALEDAIRKGVWTCPDRTVLQHVTSFVIGPDGKPGAPRTKYGEGHHHGELVIASAIGWMVRQIPVQDWTVGGTEGRWAI